MSERSEGIIQHVVPEHSDGSLIRTPTKEAGQ
jgi:hypothetical protein